MVHHLTVSTAEPDLVYRYIRKLQGIQLIIQSRSIYTFPKLACLASSFHTPSLTSRFQKPFNEVWDMLSPIMCSCPSGGLTLPHNHNPLKASSSKEDKGWIRQ